MKKIFLCAISNISSGSCNEDCGFCTQSVKYKANIERYKEKSIDEIVKEAEAAYKNQASGFCLVTSGKGITDKKLDFVTKAAKAVKNSVPSLNLIACNGTATLEQLKELKRSGIDSYNHNLETSQNYYQKICTTHSWDERYQTCLNIKEAGLKLCTGGIFGMGETKTDRASFIDTLKSLEPESVPINFFHPNSALPIKEEPLNCDEALDIIRYVKKQLQNTKIMIAGGREITFKERQSEIFAAGADAIVIGNYLTTSGNEPNKDLEMIKKLNLEIAQSCNG